MYSGTSLSRYNTSKTYFSIRSVTAAAAMARLDRAWRNGIRFTTKYRLCKSFELQIVLHVCKTCTLLDNIERERIKAFVNKRR